MARYGGASGKGDGVKGSNYLFGMCWAQQDSNLELRTFE